MRGIFVSGLLSLIFSIQVPRVIAAEETSPKESSSEKPEESIEIPMSQKIAMMAKFGTALVQNYTINVFNPVENRGSDRYSQIGSTGRGSGVIFEVSETRGLIVTNHHVVRKDPLEAQKLFLSFYTPAGRLAKIPAKLVKKFDIIDMAILEFDPRDLPRGTILGIAKRPSPDQIPYLMQPGRPILIQGNPMGEIGWTSNGVIANSASTLQPNLFGVAAPINPGNSGGPIFDEKTGLFLGLSTSKLMQADGMGFATPVELIEALFQEYKNGDPDNFEAYIRLGAQPITLAALEKRGLLDFVKKAEPELVQSSKSLIIFNEPAPESGLQNLDYLLSINGKVIGADIEQLYRVLLLSTNSHCIMKILRNSKILNVEVNLQNIKTELMKRETDFMIIGGLFLQDLLPQEIDSYTGGHQGVIVNEVLHDTFGQSLLNKGLVNTGSVIQAIRIGDDNINIPISNLGDLRRALTGVRPGVSVEISLHRSGVFVIPSTGENQSFLDPQALTISLPISEPIYTDKDFSLEALKQSFPFPQPDLLKMKWRDLVKVSCKDRLKSLAARVTTEEVAGDFQI